MDRGRNDLNHGHVFIFVICVLLGRHPLTSRPVDKTGSGNSIQLEKILTFGLTSEQLIKGKSFNWDTNSGDIPGFPYYDGISYHLMFWLWDRK